MYLVDTNVLFNKLLKTLHSTWAEPKKTGAQ